MPRVPISSHGAPGRSEVFARFSPNLPDDTVATVNGEPISVEEFELAYCNKVRSDILMHYVGRVNVNDPSFWRSSIDGQVPQDQAKAAALIEAAMVKLQFIVAKKLKVTAVLTYDALTSGLDFENASRRDAVARGDVVYGPIEYTPFGYQVHVTDFIKEQSVVVLARQAEPSAVENYYNVHRGEFGGTVTIGAQRLFVLLGKNNIDLNNCDMAEAESILQRARESLVTDGRIDRRSIVRTSSRFQLKSQRLEMDSTFRSDELKHGGRLYEIAEMLAEGQVSEVFQTVSPVDLSQFTTPLTLNVLECVTRRKETRFSEVRDLVRKCYAENQYGRLMEYVLSDAEIFVNDRMYDLFEVT